MDVKKGSTVVDIKQLSVDGKRIRSKLEIDKVYLDDALDLDSFATSLEMSKKYVSDVINQNFGMSFKDLINRYRVDEAKSLMMEHKGTKAIIVDIGLRSGFNNKVSFYRTFKKQTGMSPTDFCQSL